MSALPERAPETVPGAVPLKWTDTTNRITVEIFPDVLRRAAQANRNLGLYGIFVDGERRIWTVTSCAPLSETKHGTRPDLIGVATTRDNEELPAIAGPVSPMLLVSTDGNTGYLGLWTPGTSERTFLTVFSSGSGAVERTVFEHGAGTGRGRTQVRLEVPQWVWAAGLILAAGALSSHYYLKFRETATAPPAETVHRERVAYGFGMQASRQADSLDVTWDATTPALRSARSGVLKVADGDQTIAIPLAAADIAAGRMTYVPRSDSLGLELSVETRQGPMSERVRVMLERGQAPVIHRVDAPRLLQTATAPAQTQATAEQDENAAQTGTAREARNPVRHARVPPERKPSVPAPVVLTPAPTLVASALPASQADVPFRSSVPGPPELRPAATFAGPPERKISVIPAVPTRQIAPVVPETLRKVIMGRVTIEVTARVEPNGSVIGVQTPAYSGIASHLAAAAETAVRGWRFRPATLDGKPVESVHLVRFGFDRSR